MNTQGTKDKTNVEERLEVIIQKVEKSGWPDTDKEAFYAKMSEYLRSVVLPVVLNYAPETELQAMVGDKNKQTVDAYVSLLQQSFSNPKMFADLNSAFHSVLNDVDAALAKGGIV